MPQRELADVLDDINQIWDRVDTGTDQIDSLLSKFVETARQNRSSQIAAEAILRDILKGEKKAPVEFLEYCAFTLGSAEYRKTVKTLLDRPTPPGIDRRSLERVYAAFSPSWDDGELYPSLCRPLSSVWKSLRVSTWSLHVSAGARHIIISANTPIRMLAAFLGLGQPSLPASYRRALRSYKKHAGSVIVSSPRQSLPFEARTTTTAREFLNTFKAAPTVEATARRSSISANSSVVGSPPIGGLRVTRTKTPSA